MKRPLRAGGLSVDAADKVAKLEPEQRASVLNKVDARVKPAEAIRETNRETVRANL